MRQKHRGSNSLNVGIILWQQLRNVDFYAVDSRVERSIFMKKGISIILAMCLIMGVFMPVTGKATDDLGYYSWEGEWDSDWGNIVITQKGNQISGTYTHDNGRISGMVSGNTITGTWAEYPSYSAPNDAGDIIFEMASDGKSFSGKWRFETR